MQHIRNAYFRTYFYQEGRTPSETASLLGLPPEDFHTIEKNTLEKLRSDTRWGYIRWGIAGYVRRRVLEEYQRGYHTGYCDGYRRGMEEPPAPITDDILDLPLEMLGLTRRTFNCLDRYGYQHVRDIVTLKEDKILVIRNLGIVAAREIVDKLHEYGIYHTNWEIFLRKSPKYRHRKPARTLVWRSPKLPPYPFNRGIATSLRSSQ